MSKFRLYIIALLLGLFLTNVHAQDGKTLFDDNCAACHKMGMRLVGPDLVGVVDRRSEEWAKAFISNSTALIESGDADAKAIFDEFKIPMTAFEDALSDEEITAVVAYLKNYKPVVVEVKKETPAPVKAKKVVKVKNEPTSPVSGILKSVLILLASVIIVMLLMILSNIRKYFNGNKPEADLENTSKGFFSKMFVGEYVTSSTEGHEYDGIRELDNTMPPWLQGIFYITIFWAIVYLLNYFVINPQDTQLKEYQDEMAAAVVKYGDMDAIKIKIAQVDDATKLASAKETFIAKCAACHLADGGGSVGPNLTDEYWLNGGSIKDVFNVIRDGVPAKGMISWKGQLSDVEILNVASYIRNLKGTTPANAKDPQGDKYTE